MGLLDFFTWGLGYYKGKKCWSYADLYAATERGAGTVALVNEKLPYCLSMQPLFWEKTKELYEYTAKDGHEYAVSVWWAAGDVVVTPPERGDTESVTSNYQLQLQYDPVDQTYASKTVTVNGQVIFTQSVRYEDIPKNGKLAMLFHLHTHPQEGQSQIGERPDFFSAVDLRSFLTSKVAVFGVITDRIYLLMKPGDFSASNIEFDDYDITPTFLKEQFNIVVYEGSWHTAVFEKKN